MTDLAISLSPRNLNFRRHFTWKTLWYGLIYNRRTNSRRQQEPFSPYNYDRLPALAVVLTFVLLFLSSLDAYFTLYILHHGGEELNPWMEASMNQGFFSFISQKIGLSAASLLLILLYSRYKLFGILPSQWLFYPALAGYLWLISYEHDLISAIKMTHTNPVALFSFF